MPDSLFESLNRVAMLRREQQRRWRSGEQVKVEELLERDPELGLDEQVLLDLIYNEMRLLADRGDTMTLDVYQHRFPALGAKLALLFEVHETLVSLRRARLYEATELAGEVPFEAVREVDDVIDRFEAEWRSGKRPRIEEFRGGRSLDAPTRLRLSLELVSIDMEFRWREAAKSTAKSGASPGPLIEEYLTAFPELGPPDQPFAELVVEEYRIRQRYAAAPRPQEFVDRFSGYGEEIRELLHALEQSVSRASLSETSEKLSSPSYETSQVGEVDHASRANAPARPELHDSDAPLPYTDFRFERKIGSGGMGTVYRALQVSLSKPVAIKVLKSARGESGVERFLREGRSVGRLRHPQIVDIHGIGRTPDGGYFMVMDLVEGEDLGSMLRAGTLSINDVFLVVAIARVIQHAHQNGVIHRDLKPSNILVDKDGQMLVSDFGLAKLFRTEDPDISATNELLGTPSYMAPEQASRRWGDISTRTDVYGLGGILYAVLTGQPPFSGPTFTDVLAQVLSDDPPVPPSQLRAEVTPELDRICLKCLSKKSDDRYQTAGEVADALVDYAASLGIEGYHETLPSGQVRLAELVESSRKPDDIQPSTFDPSRSSGPPRGALPLDSLFYLERAADKDLQSALARQDSIILIRGARQMGKTSLLARGIKQVRQSGARVVLTDLQKLRDEELQSLDLLYSTIGEWMADELDLDSDPADHWDSRRSASVNFERFVRRVILKTSEVPVVWGLDEVDRLLECPYRSEVFGLFRSWHNARALQPMGPWSKLTLVMAYATEAHLFISDPNQSPFNVGTLISMEDFSREQIASLNGRYGNPLRDDEEFDRFTGVVGGHPYLVSRGLYEMAAHSLDIAKFEEQANQDAGIFGDHLRRLLALLRQDPEMHQAFRELLDGTACRSVESFYRLRSAGFISGDSATAARPRCQLYTSYFQRHMT